MAASRVLDEPRREKLRQTFRDGASIDQVWALCVRTGTKVSRGALARLRLEALQAQPAPAVVIEGITRSLPDGVGELAQLQHRALKLAEAAGRRLARAAGAPLDGDDDQQRRPRAA